MALYLTQAPPAALEALTAAMPRVAALPSITLRGPAIGVATRDFTLAARVPPSLATEASADGAIPAPVHVVGLQELAAGGDVRKAPLAIWTHLLMEQANVAAAVLADVDAKTMKFAAVTEGEQVRSIGQSVREAAGAGGGDYELAMIRVPALYLSAVWLKGRNGAADVLIPSDSPKSPLVAGKRYSPEEFNAALKAVAEQELRETDPLKGG